MRQGNVYSIARVKLGRKILGCVGSMRIYFCKVYAHM